MTVTPEQARAAAIQMIRPYVERGDSLESLREGQMGSYNPRYRCVIGSVGMYECRAPRKLGVDAITVGAVNGEPCCYHFRVSELYDEIKSGSKQLSLFEVAS